MLVRYMDMNKYDGEKYVEELHTGSKVVFSGVCRLGTNHEVSDLPVDLEKYRSGMLIQHAFPYLSTQDREFLMTGMCCDSIWGTEE